MTNPENNDKVELTIGQTICMLVLIGFAWPISVILILCRIAWDMSSDVLTAYKSLK